MGQKLSGIPAAIISRFFRKDVGKVVYFAMSAPPDGYLKANGAALSRAAYADLFAAIGTQWGVGDGSTTFNVPDLRGVFVRGFDDGRGLEGTPDRAFGTYQADALKSHGHSINDAGHSHPYTAPNGGDGFAGGGFPGSKGPVAANTVARITGISINATGGVETVPKNTTLLACIKY